MAEDNWRNSEQEKPFPGLERVVSFSNQSHTDEYVHKIVLSFFLQIIHHLQCYVSRQLLQIPFKLKSGAFSSLQHCSK